MKALTLTTLLGLLLAGPALADRACDPSLPPPAVAMEKVEGADRAGQYQQVYKLTELEPCFSDNSPLRARFFELRLKAGTKLGQAAEKQRQYAQAFKYYDDNIAGMDADRVKMKLVEVKASDVQAVGDGVFYFRSLRDTLSQAPDQEMRSTGYKRLAVLAATHMRSQEGAFRMDPKRSARLKEVQKNLARLEAMARKKGEKLLADDDHTFRMRNVTRLSDDKTVGRLNKAKAWLDLAGQGKRATERAVSHGDALATKSTPAALSLAVSYYDWAGIAGKQGKVRDKAHRLGDASLKKGDKKSASEFYAVAGLGDKSSKLQEEFEAEQEKAENKRKDNFKKGQKSLEKELGF